MRKHHPDNERIKRRHLQFLREAKRLSEASVDQAASAIAAFEASIGFRDFKKFHIEQARKFKRDLAAQINPTTGKQLAKGTMRSRLMALKTFFQWLADQPGYRSRIGYSDAEYFNLSANDTRIARAVREKPVPSMEQIRHTLSIMPANTDVERRDRALVAFTLLSGARDNAIASMSLKHIDVERRLVHQDAREVRTKRAKTFTSSFFPVGEDIEAIVVDWIDHLRIVLHFGEDDPLFPVTRVAPNGSGLFAANGLERRHWKNASAIRRIFRESFEAADLPYFNPHSLRDTLTQLGQRQCRTPEEFKAWSQNLGHEKVMTTFISYGSVASERQMEIMANLGHPNEDLDDELIHRIANMVRMSR
ncbi:tyrosine-type recombinase/integrase [Minwuia sp.]|uniref:tyrosine-type recombinase/integrase n=1 Tax=Minwuia sp. TaxID=2493630 RepID=UPI003A8FB2E8